MNKVLCLCGFSLVWFVGLVMPVAAVEVLRDPTIPLHAVAQKSTKSKLELQAVFNRQGEKEAVINGKTVKRGAIVSGIEVLSIGEKSVRYRKNGKEATLYLRTSVLDKRD